MRRVLLLNNVPTPYFDPLFERLGREAGWELTVCYSALWNQAVGWEENSRAESRAHRTIVLDRRRPGLRARFGSWTAAAVALIEILLRERPDYLICYGYTLLPQMSALLWAIVTRTPFAMIGDANYYCEGSTGVKRVLKGLWLRGIARRAAALIAVGAAGRLFWESHGARAEQLFESPFAVDNEFFSREPEGRRAAAQSLRERWGLAGKTVFLFVGRLVRRKNVHLVIRAIRDLPDADLALVIAGGGEERAALESLAEADPRIVFAGIVAPPDLPALYTAADVLVLVAEQEPWGLVVNEAMASGLAVLAHRHCGAAVDLVDETNGARVHQFEVDEIKAAIRSIASDRERLRGMQDCSGQKIKKWTLERAACGIIRAVEESAPPPEPAPRLNGPSRPRPGSRHEIERREK
ncbi:MAG: glycosyltransferase [Blastocatellia bacterium]|nr:glycosyltransferase [Blastocatellia bacterium]